MAAAASPFAAQFPGTMLAAHNAVRAQAGAPALAWDTALGNARRGLCAADGVHRTSSPIPTARRGPAPARICGWARAVLSPSKPWSAAGRRSGDNSCPASFPAVSRSGNWADVGHYTQMIWPTTTRVGCAHRDSTPSTDYLVCRYSPAGNIDGRGGDRRRLRHRPQPALVDRPRRRVDHRRLRRGACRGGA